MGVIVATSGSATAVIDVESPAIAAPSTDVRAAIESLSTRERDALHHLREVDLRDRTLADLCEAAART